MFGTEIKELTVKQRVALSILQGMIAHYGLEDDEPDNIEGAMEDSMKMAEVALKVMGKIK